MLRLLALTVSVTLIFCATAGAATTPLGSRTFDQACAAAAAGDIVTLPAGTFGSQSVSCAKAVTFQGAGPATTIGGLTVRGSGTTIAGMHVAGGADIEAASNITIRDMIFNDQVYLERNDGILFDHDTWQPSTPGAVTPNGDYLDIFPASSGASTQPNNNITVQDSIFTGLRSPSSSAHSDAIQLYNEGPPHTNIKILRTRFSNNECINIRMNDQDQVLLENNVFGDSFQGISGCGFYDLDVSSARVTARYNTFVGSQQIQGTSPSAPTAVQTWVGNAGVGFNNDCSGAGRSGAGAFSHNVWTGMKCGTTDKQVTSLGINSDGSPQAASPLIDYGDATIYPAKDIVGATRPQGAFADSGAYEQAGLADTVAPDTSITSAPANGTDTSATVTFTATESGSTFECKLDSGAYAGCSSPKSYQGLALGSHTVSVRATDGAGNVDASPASASWTVSAPADTTAPDTTITDSPSDGTAQAVSFTFTASETGSTFECKLDAGAYASCSSPKAYSGLTVGAHTFSVRATDAAGNTDQSPATKTWNVTANCTDQLTAMTADRDAQKARADQAEADLAAMTSSRDAWKARAEKAEDQVARIKAITGE